MDGRVKKTDKPPIAGAVAELSRPPKTVPLELRRRWAARRFVPGCGGGAGFGVRLLAAILITLAVVGAVGYVLMAGQLRGAQLADYASTHRADARAVEAVGRHEGTSTARLAHINELLRAMSQRPGALKTLLIDSGSVVIASGTTAGVGTQRESDPRIESALRDATSYAGLGGDPRRHSRDFEFVAPVRLPAGRYALEVSYDHRVLDDDLRNVRRTLALVGLLALIGGTGLFYVVGGRVLLRSHRIALQRATRDGLTDLPNHRAFQDEFPLTVAAATRYQEPLALIVFDLDDFKFLNDRHGHPYGDAVLRRVAEVLRAGRVEDRAYRVGGDEFAMLLAHTDGDGARTIAARLARAFSSAEVAVSMGISELRDGQPARDLRAEADAALYETKRNGRVITHFDEIRDQVVITTAARTDGVRRLIDEERVSIVYQPIWDLDSQRLLGIEALMRPHPEDELSGPAEAFDLAEQIGRVHDLDVLCVTHALQDVPELPDGALLFLNLSPYTLDLDANGNDWLPDAVRHVGLTPDRVVIEVTERFGARTDAVVVCLQRLRDEGFQIALDDVGTGNSGLEMLQKVSADYVKIDRGIVLAAATDRSARAVLMAMATYARQTGSYVIAEGIEDQETLDFLQTVDDHEARPQRIIQGGQGFGLGRPAADGAVGQRPGLLAHPAEPQRI
ncbi:MAG: cph2 16 [Conexibacter sp.]|nr:cph2 16 [Conexibacter sp.]